MRGPPRGKPPGRPRPARAALRRPRASPTPPRRRPGSDPCLRAPRPAPAQLGGERPPRERCGHATPDLPTFYGTSSVCCRRQGGGKSAQQEPARRRRRLPRSAPRPAAAASGTLPSHPPRSRSWEREAGSGHVNHPRPPASRLHLPSPPPSKKHRRRGKKVTNLGTASPRGASPSGPRGRAPRSPRRGPAAAVARGSSARPAPPHRPAPHSGSGPARPGPKLRK